MNTLRVDRRDDATALITINRAGQAFLRDLPATLAALDEDPGVQACVIAGLDEPFRTAGESADFGAPDATRRQARLALGGVQAIANCRMLTVGLAGCVACGVAARLILACDVVLASASARFVLHDEMDADLAERLGLVDRVVAPERLIDEALAVAAAEA